MAIDLRLLPDPIILKKGLSWLFWCITLILSIVLGFIAIVIMQFNGYLALGHIIIAIVVSIISWLIMFFLWLYIRGYKEFYAEAWNRQYENKKQQLIEFGQRPLYVIFYQLSSEFGHYNHARALVEGLFSLDAKVVNSYYGTQSPIIHSKYQFNDLKSNDFYKKMEFLFDGLVPTLTVLKNEIFSSSPKHVRLFIDVPISVEDIKQIWENRLGKITLFDSWQVINAKKSTVFLDSWLDDESHDDHILCCVSLHLFDYPSSYSSESMTSMVCLGNNFIKEKAIIQYIQENKLLITALQRTETGKDLDYVLEHAELWGLLNCDENQVVRLWLNILSPDAKVKILSRYAEKMLPLENSHHVDSIFGISGYCDYWVALVLAIEYSAHSEGKQLIIGEKEKDFNATIVNKTSLLIEG
ncbi:hypothetical protein RHO14_06010 [Orbus wheelerorum]|uniref:hypothetical protein n=1 Tax=Orbus wheelerorum TaxID=3074111 RepID=UPI00370DD7C7